MTVASLGPLKPFWATLLHLPPTLWTSHQGLTGLEEVLDTTHHSVPTSALLVLEAGPFFIVGPSCAL